MNIENLNFNNVSEDKQKSIKDAWEKILSRFPEKLQEEFRIERPTRRIRVCTHIIS